MGHVKERHAGFNHKEANMYVVNYFLGRDDLLMRISLGEVCLWG